MRALRYDARMATQDPKRSFGQALRAAIRAAGSSQAKLARDLNIDPGQVSRWANDKSVPFRETVNRIEAVLGTSLVEAFASAVPDYELFVSAPIIGLAADRVADHHDAVATVVEAAREHVNNVYWPGQNVKALQDLVAPDLATERNLKVLANCPAFLYVQFDEIVHPSSALVEIGIALGRRAKTTFILRQGVQGPFMLKGFTGVAASLSFLPKAHVYWIESPEEAAELLRKNGRELLGLA